jgi:cysteine-rich repeat protein
MLRQRPVLRAGSPAGLLVVLAAAGALGGGCNAIFSFDPLDSGEGDGATDTDGNGEVEDDGDVRDDGDVPVGRDDAEGADGDDDAGEVEDGDDGGRGCGNGTLDPGEECDDGNADNTDECTTECLAARCSDGYVQAGVEECDDGNADNTDSCLDTCVAAACGDGYVEAGVEECDDANPDNTDSCLDTCVAATCGDGYVEAGVEECDDGAANSDTAVDACRTSCRRAYCGDGVVDAGEACDDGNRIDTDGCRNTCALPGCGDGIVQAGEECDDGNASNTDACLNTCVAATCGDGYVRSGVEQCDTTTPRPCATGCGTSGLQNCVDCSWAATCAPPIEECNGLDDDCDTACDNGFVCCAGTNSTCTTSCLTTGRRVCSAACGWGVCTPPAETCNGLDDDCDTVCDNGFSCCAGSSVPCATSCSSTGTRACSAACGLGACVAPAETCNGLDDDCDTACDNGFGCCAGSTEPCATSCGSTGTRSCSSSCAWNSCVTPAETCNGRDDDCDTVVDEGCSSCTACSGATDISAGGRFSGTLTAGASTSSGTCGGLGAEAHFSFTTTAVQDVFLTTHGSSFDTVLYVTECTCAGPERGCNDDADGRLQSVLYLRDLPAGTYNVIVDAKTAGGGGAYQLDAYFTAPGVSGDRCGDPLRLTNTGDASRNSCLFSADYVPSRGGDCTYMGTGGGEDVVYYFVLTTTSSVRLQTCTSTPFCPSGGCVDTDIYIRDVCTVPIPQRACSEDACGYRDGGVSIHSDTGSVSLPAGIYYFIVDGYQETTGTWMHCGFYNLTVTGIV